MKEIIIDKLDLEKYMDNKSYKLFIVNLRKKLKTNKPIWIIAQVLEKK